MPSSFVQLTVDTERSGSHPASPWTIVGPVALSIEVTFWSFFDTVVSLHNRHDSSEDVFLEGFIGWNPRFSSPPKDVIGVNLPPWFTLRRFASFATMGRCLMYIARDLHLVLRLTNEIA